MCMCVVFCSSALRQLGWLQPFLIVLEAAMAQHIVEVTRILLSLLSFLWRKVKS